MVNNVCGCACSWSKMNSRAPAQKQTAQVTKNHFDYDINAANIETLPKWRISNSQIFSIFEGLEELHDEVTVRLRHDVFLRHDVLLLSRFDDLCFLHLLQRKRAWCVVFNLHEFNATETADALKMGKETLVRWKSSVRHNALEWKTFALQILQWHKHNANDCDELELT